MKFLDKLLDYYNLNIENYEVLKRKVTESDIPLFTIFEDIDLIKNKILEKIKNNKKILIYGDYDADGVLATSIMVYTLRKLNANCSYYIPSRYLDTYGLTVDKVKIAKEKGFDLIITVDNGVSCLDSINLCNELNLDIIITDHHEYDESFKTKYFMHPKRSKLSVITSGAAIAFFLSYALLKEVDPYLLSLAGISIIADMMPIKNENRDIVKLAIYLINKYKFPQLTILSGLYSFDEKSLSLNLIPKINGVGRVCQNKEVNLLVKYFTTSDFRTLYLLKDKFNEINDKKKVLVKNALNNIKIDIKKEDTSIVLKVDEILGLGGILSNRYLKLYNLPTAIFILDKGALKGSIRTDNGCDLIPFLNSNKDLFITSGGHKHASGVSINIDKLDEFKNRFNNYCKNNPLKENNNFIDILIEEVNFNNYEIIKSFSPFGFEFEEPLFLLHNIDLSSYVLMGSKKEHLKITYNNCSLVWFNFPKEVLKNTLPINLLGRFNINGFKNNVELQFKVENIFK